MAQLTTARSTRVTPIVALDYGSAVEALQMVDLLGDACGFYKIGLELFTAEGPEVVRQVRARGADVFLDLKLHDIPNTVAGAARSAAALGVRLLTVHASGGEAMIRGAVDGAGPGCGILAVTVLTSFEAAGLATVWGREAVDAEAEVVRLAGIAAAAGARGVVCSGQEAAAVHGRYGERLELLVPGIRLAGGSSHDQARVASPAAAAAAGARYIILGRAVTQAADPKAAMAAVRGELGAP